MISPLFFFFLIGKFHQTAILAAQPQRKKSIFCCERRAPLERSPSMIIYPEERTREGHDLAIGYKNT